MATASRLLLSYTLLVLFLVGCGTTGTAPPELGYNPLYTPLDHLAKLIEEKNYDQASEVYNREAEFFATYKETEATAVIAQLKGTILQQGKKPTLALLADLGSGLNGRFRPRIEAAITALKAMEWPSLPMKWGQVRRTISGAMAILEEQKKHRVLSLPQNQDARAAELVSLIGATEGKILASASSVFSRYEIGQWEDFFRIFPVTANPKLFLEREWRSISARLAVFPAKELLHFYKTYKEHLQRNSTGQLTILHYRAILKEKDTDRITTFPEILESAKATQQAGFPLDKIPDAKIALIEITSPTLLKEKEIEFPVAIENDLPFAADKASIDRVFDTPLARDADIVILLDVAAARVFRNIKRKEAVTSEFKSGTRSEHNPDYAAAQMEVNTATVDYQATRVRSAASTCTGYGCLIQGLADGIAIAAASSKLEEAQKKLLSTPSTIEKNVYSPYQFNRAYIDSKKEMTVFYYVIDRISKELYRGSFDASESQSFRVNYGLRDADRNPYSHTSGAHKEADVSSFEGKPVKARLSSILNQFMANKPRRETLPREETLRAEFLKKRNETVAKFQQKQYTTTQKDDLRFKSVVVVRTPGGTLGTGFFVKNDIVVTNYHVIENVKFVELKMFNGQDTFGKIVAHDIRMDLALVKVQARGEPASLYSGTALPVGSTVEAVGHPQGLEFTMTRGIISAVRDIPTKFAPSAKPVKFVQTDTPVNRGNSGGPLFLGDKVIGVNTQKLAAVDLEGLSFALHYGELRDFLARNGIPLE